MFVDRSRDDVGHCLWVYLDFCAAHLQQMTRAEVSMCALVCTVCTQCARTLRWGLRDCFLASRSKKRKNALLKAPCFCFSQRKKNVPAVVLRMQDMMDEPDIKEAFRRAKGRPRHSQMVSASLPTEGAASRSRLLAEKAFSNSSAVVAAGRQD